MTEQRLSLGRWGEQQAVRYLKRRLYRIIETNYRAPTGEIDIIARRGKIRSALGGNGYALGNHPYRCPDPGATLFVSGTVAG